MQKFTGGSPATIILTTLTVIFFVALFVWQIEHYLNVSQDSKLQEQIASMNLMIEADSIELSSLQKFAYLHEDNDISQPIRVPQARGNFAFEGSQTLASLFTRNQFLPSIPGKNNCFIYMYLPPQMGYATFDFYEDSEPAYVLAAWSEYQQRPVVVADRHLQTWAEDYLTKDFFYCEPKNLSLDQVAIDANGYALALPGYSFQFADSYYSRVQTPENLIR